MRAAVSRASALRRLGCSLAPTLPSAGLSKEVSAHGHAQAHISGPVRAPVVSFPRAWFASDSSSSPTTHTMPPLPRAYNSLSASLEPITAPAYSPPSPADAGLLSRSAPSIGPDSPTRPLYWYICGPTVYDAAHLGHARTYVAFDLIHRMATSLLRQDVLLTMGVTDIDDKIINRAKALNIPWKLLARHHEHSFRADLRALNVRPPAALLRVSEHVPDIIQFIAEIASRGLAYEAPDGVYFDVGAFRARGHAYGKLRLTPEGIAAQCAAWAAGKRLSQDDGEGTLAAAVDAALGLGEVDVDTGASLATSPATFLSEANAARTFKRSPADFALWKLTAQKEGSTEAWWPSPWGDGRPGWHIECSAMTGAFFGPRLDAHGGGADLKFPHHCNEIAQSEARYGLGVQSSDSHGEWCSQWMHTGHLHIEGRKMSKSLKNFITIRELLSQGVTPDEFRMTCLLSHYRSGADHSAARLRGARAAVAEVRDFAELVERVTASKTGGELGKDGAGADARAAAHAFAAAAASSAALPTETASEWDTSVRPGPREASLLASLHGSRRGVLEAAAADFDGPRVWSALQDGMSAARRYVAALDANDAVPGAGVPLLQRAVADVCDTLAALGFVFAGARSGSHPAASASGGAGAGDEWVGEVTAADVAAQHPETPSVVVMEALSPQTLGLKPAAAAALLSTTPPRAPADVSAVLSWPSRAQAPASEVADVLAGFRDRVRASALGAKPSKASNAAVAAAKTALEAAGATEAGKDVTVSAETLAALLEAATSGATLASTVLKEGDTVRDAVFPALGFALKDVATAGDVAAQSQGSVKGYYLRPLQEGEAEEMQRTAIAAAQTRIDRAKGTSKKTQGGKK